MHDALRKCVCGAPTWQPATPAQWSRSNAQQRQRLRWEFVFSLFLLNILSFFFSWTLACILLPAFYNVLLQLCFMNFLSTQPADAVIWEKLGPATVEPAVQEEQEENSACINDDDGHFRLWRGESFSFKVRAPAPASCHVCYTCLYYLLWWNPALQSLTLQTSNLYLVFFLFFFQSKLQIRKEYLCTVVRSILHCKYQ